MQPRTKRPVGRPRKRPLPSLSPDRETDEPATARARRGSISPDRLTSASIRRSEEGDVASGQAAKTTAAEKATQTPAAPTKRPVGRPRKVRPAEVSRQIDALSKDSGWYKDVVRQDIANNLTKVGRNTSYRPDDEPYKGGPLPFRCPDAVKKRAMSDEGSFLLTWKICFHLFGRSPFSIISPAYDMFFDREHSLDDGSDLEWPRTFCQRLCRILTHPLWTRDDELITCVIRFAVLCRTDYRVAVRPLLGPGSDVLSALETVLSEGSRGSSPHQAHCSARATKRRHSLESDFLLHLGEVISKKRNRRVAVQSSLPGIRIRSEDLTVVLEALDTFSGRSGWGFFPSSELAYQGYMQAREGTLRPVRAEFNQVYVNAWLVELHRMHILENADGDKGRFVRWGEILDGFEYTPRNVENVEARGPRAQNHPESELSEFVLPTHQGGHASDADEGPESPQDSGDGFQPLSSPRLSVTESKSNVVSPTQDIHQESSPEDIGTYFRGATVDRDTLKGYIQQRPTAGELTAIVTQFCTQNGEQVLDLIGTLGKDNNDKATLDGQVQDLDFRMSAHHFTRTPSTTSSGAKRPSPPDETWQARSQELQSQANAHLQQTKNPEEKLQQIEAPFGRKE
ncbi:hypothetical protein HJFPF1_07642 [Paramyrothecium foliicola]|nr:hypothetical protein HJFPF1_07642 [Paramyrothecium foliicola]